MSVGNKIDIGNLLLSYNLITEEQLIKAREESQKRNKEIKEVLIELKYVDEGAINYVLSSHLDLPYVHLSAQMVDHDIVRSIPREILQRYKVVPIMRINGEINLVMADPTDNEAIREIEAISGCSVNVSIGLSGEILEVIDQICKKEIVQIKKPGEELLVDTSGVAFVYHHLTTALDEGATQIYIEPTSTNLRIRYRKKDGRLDEKKPQPLSLYPGVSSRLKIMANMDTGKKGVFQEANIRSRIGDCEVYLHISVLPSIYGECWAIRILDQAKSIIKLENLGLPQELIPQIKESINQRGIIIITGPMGSGKTTTAYSLLSCVNTKNKLVATIEESVLYQNEEFIQIESRGASALERVISQGADLIMVEDMNNEQVLKLCFDAALGGRSILGQMFHPYAFDLLDYLIRIGLSPRLIASLLLMIIAQRKVDILCSSCKEKYPSPPELGLGDIYRAKGCQRCNWTGYEGAGYIYEVLVFKERIKEMLVKNEDLKKIEEVSCEIGFVSLKKILKERLISGIIGQEEVLK